jgi:hypothetical protein
MRGKAARAVPAESNTTKDIATSTLIVGFMMFSFLLPCCQRTLYSGTRKYRSVC